jgi:GNAT superfamily N-acetyltransferase
VGTFADFRPGWRRPQAFDEGNPRRLERVLPDETFFGLIAEAAGEPIGFVMFWQAVSAGDQSAPEPGLAHLSQIFVLRDQWGSGVAAELLTGAVGEARRRGYERMRLFTPRDHGRARRFYEREGWRPTGEKRFGPELGLQIVEYAIDL